MKGSVPVRPQQPAPIQRIGMVFFIAAAFFGSTGALAQTSTPARCTLEGKPIDPTSPAAMQGNSGRLLCRDNTTGKVTRDSTFEDGHQMGLSRLFYPDGRLRRAAFSIGAGGDRAVAEFTARGSLSLLRCADKPLLQPAVDDARLCGFDGNIAATVDLFDEQDVRRSRVTHLNGRRLRSESFYDNGVVATQEELIGNQRIERQYASDGSRRSETTSLLQRGRAQRLSFREFAPNDLLMREQVWNDAGEATQDDLYFADTGGPRKTTRYHRRSGERTADVVEYFQSGQVAFRGHFLAPAQAPMQPVGTHQRFDAQGALVAESVYSARGKLLRERAWGADGQLLVDDSVGESAQGIAGTAAPRQ